MKEDSADSRPTGRGRPDEDLPLVEQVLEGDARAFEELVRRHEQRVYRTTVAICGNAEDAEDAMQDTFLKVYKHLPAFRRESRFTTWLTGIAVNESLQVLRRRRDTQSLDEPAMSEQGMMPRQVQDWHADPEQLYSRKEVRQYVEEAVRALPPAYRVVFILRDVEELSNEEVAEILGLSLAALKSRILRARLMVRETLAARFQKPLTLMYRVMQAGMMLRDAFGARFGPSARQKAGR